MNFSIIGSGNIAHYIGTRCKEAGNVIENIISTNETTGTSLAEKLDATYLSDYNQSQSKTFLLAIPDDAIRDLISEDFFNDKSVIHTSGSIGLEELTELSEHRACIWPIFSIKKEKLPTRNDIPFVLQSSNQPSRKKAVSFLKCLTNNVSEVDDKQKAILHLSAVLVNNFTNHLFAQSEQLLSSRNLSFNDLMIPIIQNTVNKLSHESPINLQTGPAVRGDQGTINKHLDVIQENPQLQEIYKVISKAISSF